jgi:hypothetical protein
MSGILEQSLLKNLAAKYAQDIRAIFVRELSSVIQYVRDIRAIAVREFSSVICPGY